MATEAFLTQGIEVAGFTAERSVAVAYAQSLRQSLFSSAVLEGSDAKLAELQREFDSLIERTGNKPSLASLFQIEARHLALIATEKIPARLWALEERFRRLVPANLVQRLERYFDGAPGDQPSYLQQDVESQQRQRALSILDIAHSHILFGMARERALSRLRTILTLLLTLVVTIVIALGFFVSGGIYGALALAVSGGLIGAYCSAMQRLQKEGNNRAKPSDSFTDLLIYRTSYGSIVSSVMIGGIFGAILYVIVLSGYIQQIVPGGRNGETPSAAQSEKLDAESETRSVNNADFGRTESQSQAEDAEGRENIQSNGNRKADYTANPTDIARDCKTIVGSNCNAFLALAAGSANWQIIDLFKLLLLAFVAGFAERFVPDILNGVAERRKLEAQ